MVFNITDTTQPIFPPDISIPLPWPQQNRRALERFSSAVPIALGKIKIYFNFVFKDSVFIYLKKIFFKFILFRIRIPRFFLQLKYKLTNTQVKTKKLPRISIMWTFLIKNLKNDRWFCGTGKIGVIWTVEWIFHWI